MRLDLSYIDFVSTSIESLIGRSKAQANAQGSFNSNMILELDTFNMTPPIQVCERSGQYSFKNVPKYIALSPYHSMPWKHEVARMGQYRHSFLNTYSRTPAAFPARHAFPPL
jgi:hypothetical protein